MTGVDVGFRRCEDKNCRSRHPKGVFLVDGHVKCFHCHERFLETHFVEDHRIYRLSDDEEDFCDEMHRSLPARISACKI